MDDNNFARNASGPRRAPVADAAPHSAPISPMPVAGGVPAVRPVRSIAQSEPRTHTILDDRRKMAAVGGGSIIGFILIGMLMMWVVTSVGRWWEVHFTVAALPLTVETSGVTGLEKLPQSTTLFECTNLHQQVVVNVYPDGDPASHLRFIGPYLYGNGQEYQSCSVSLQDGATPGHPDAVLKVAGQSEVFRQVKAADGTYTFLPPDGTVAIPAAGGQ